jgi:hypothetical protein
MTSKALTIGAGVAETWPRKGWSKMNTSVTSSASPAPKPPSDSARRGSTNATKLSSNYNAIRKPIAAQRIGGNPRSVAPSRSAAGSRLDGQDPVGKRAEQVAGTRAQSVFSKFRPLLGHDRLGICPHRLADCRDIRIVIADEQAVQLVELHRHGGDALFHIAWCGRPPTWPR